jgi:hypothetical protein
MVKMQTMAWAALDQITSYQRIVPVRTGFKTLL